MPVAAAELAQAEPVDVNTLPTVPGDESPVPPFAAGSTPVTSAEFKSIGPPVILTKSEPFQATSALLPAVTVIPVVGPDPRITTEPVPALIRIYALLWAGAVILRVVAPLLAVHK